jgi:putative tricarboxylic transport membrane protein
MSGFDQLVNGFAIALSWKGLLYCFIGCLWGTVVGVLPGLGPLAGMTLLLPLTYGTDPAIGIIMLTGIFYGAPPSSPVSTAMRWRAAGAPVQR